MIATNLIGKKVKSWHNHHFVGEAVINTICVIDKDVYAFVSVDGFISKMKLDQLVIAEENKNERDLPNLQ